MVDEDHVVGADGAFPILMDLISVQAEFPTLLTALTLKNHSSPESSPLISAWLTMDSIDVFWVSVELSN